MTYDNLLLLVTACLAVNLSPGPSVIFVSSITAANGFKAGMAGVLGMSLAAFIYVILAATGVAAMIAASSYLFGMVQLLGAGYLFYMGLRLLRSTTRANSTISESSSGTWDYFKKGILVDLFNPKLGVFFLAFIPPFLGSVEQGGFWLSVAYGSIFVFTGCIVNGSIAFAVASGRNRIPENKRDWMLRRIPGMTLIFLSIYLFVNTIQGSSTR